MSLLSKNPFISTGNGNGTPVDVPNATTSQAGKVQLSNAIDSDSQLQASTPLAVKTALDESKSYTDDAIAGLNIQDIIDNLSDHESSLINTEQGLHGVRIWQDKLQQTNDDGTTWIDVASNISIVDDLDSTDATSALSANQGNVIKLLIEKLQLDLSDHEAKIASETEYGHIKIDNDTLKYNAVGQLYADIDTTVDWVDIQNKPTSDVADIDDAVAKKHEHINQSVLDKFSEDVNGEPLYDGLAIGSGTVVSVNGESPDENGNVEITIPTVQDGTLTDKGIVQLSNDIIEDETLSATPKAVFDALSEAKDYADTLIDDLESTLIKHSFELRPTVQYQLEFDMPAIYNQNPDYFVNLLYFNSTKVLESKYSIVEKVTGDATQGFKLVLNSPAPDYNSAIYNLVLIGGKALATGGAGNGTVISVNGILPDTTGNVELPTGVKLTKPEYVLTPTAIGQTEFDMPQEYQDNPNDYIHLLFFNTLKVRNTEYSVQNVGGIQKLVLNNPSTSLDDRYDLVLIKGDGISNGTSGGSVDLHQVIDDTDDKPVSPKAVKDYIERFFYEGSTPPNNTSLFWHKV